MTNHERHTGWIRATPPAELEIDRDIRPDRNCKQRRSDAADGTPGDAREASREWKTRSGNYHANSQTRTKDGDD